MNIKAVWPAVTAMTILASWPVSDAAAHSYHIGDIQIGHLWAKPTGDHSFRVYGPLLNNGAATDTLAAVHGPKGSKVQFATTRNGHEQPLASVKLPQGAPVSLAAWSAHIDIDQISGRFEKGKMIPLVFEFAHAGSVHVAALVESSASD